MPISIETLERSGCRLRQTRSSYGVESTERSAVGGTGEARIALAAAWRDRNGRAFAAYLHLSHPTGEKNAKTMASPDGLLIVDYAATGRPIGVEITAPQAVPLERLNQLLAEIGEAPLAEQDYKPVRAA